MAKSHDNNGATESQSSGGGEDNASVDADVLEGEIVDESESSDSAKSRRSPSQNTDRANTGTTNTGTTNTGTANDVAKTKSGRLPWVISGLLTLFLAGVFAGPWAEAGLRQLFPNLLPPESESATEDLAPQISTIESQSAAQGQRIDRLNNDIEALKRDLTSQSRQSSAASAAMQQQSERLAALESQSGDGPGAGSADVSARLAGLEAQIADLREAIGGLEARSDAIDAASASSSPTETETAPEAEEVADHIPIPIPDNIPLADAAQVAQLRARLAVMEEAFTRLDETVGATTASAELLPVSMVRLSRQIDAGQPYALALSEIRALAQAEQPQFAARLQPYLSNLDAYANGGVARLEDLQQAFPPLIAEALRSSDRAQQESWWGRAWADVKGLVVVRPTGEPQGEDVAAVLARAEAAVLRGQVASALTELDNLDPAAREVLVGWIDQASSFSAVQAALDNALRLVVSHIEGG